MNRSLVVLALLSSAASASAGPVGPESQLLATWRIPTPGIIVGSPEVFESRWPTLAIFDDDANAIAGRLFENTPVQPPYPFRVTAVLTNGDDTGFTDFVTYLTDGREQSIVVLQWSAKGSGAGGGGTSESGLIFHVPTVGPDLLGYSIDRITEDLTVDIRSPGSDPFGDGLWTDWNVAGTYEIYGLPIPEPTTAFLLAIGTSFAFSWHGRKRA